MLFQIMVAKFHSKISYARIQYCVGIFSPKTPTSYVSTLLLSGINSCFLTPSRFSPKMSRFFCVFELVKMRSMRSAQRQVELRQLGNQLPVLRKANSFSKIVCVFCLFVKLRFSTGRIGPGIKISRVIVALAKSV